MGYEMQNVCKYIDAFLTIWDTTKYNRISAH